MKRFIALAVLVFIGVATWQIGSKLSADAIGMGVGVMFGIMAGIPTALLLLASNRRASRDNDDYDQRRGRGHNGMVPYGHYPQQPPVIVLAGGQMGPQNGYQSYGQHRHAVPMLGDGHQTIETREFRVVGERENAIEEW